MLLNLAEDHLDRHGTFEAYRAAKLAIFAHQPPGTLAVVPAGLPLDDAGGAATRVTFGDGAPTCATATARCYWRGEPLMAAAEIRLRGAHNRENAMAAAAVCLARGRRRRRGARGAARRSPASRTGSRRSRRVDGVTYVNDSKATNVASARGRRSARSSAACT